MQGRKLPVNGSEGIYKKGQISSCYCELCGVTAFHAKLPGFDSHCQHNRWDWRLSSVIRLLRGKKLGLFSPTKIASVDKFNGFKG